jgi:hypothetical protein
MSNSDKPWSEEVVRDLQDSLDLGDTFAETASFLCRESTRCGRGARPGGTLGKRVPLQR